MSEEKDHVDAVRNAFHDEFARFADLQAEALPLDDLEEQLRELNDLKVRHTGKRSAIAGTMLPWLSSRNRPSWIVRIMCASDCVNIGSRLTGSAFRRTTTGSWAAPVPMPGQGEPVSASPSSRIVERRRRAILIVLVLP